MCTLPHTPNSHIKKFICTLLIGCALGGICRSPASGKERQIYKTFTSSHVTIENKEYFYSISRGIDFKRKRVPCKTKDQGTAPCSVHDHKHIHSTKISTFFRSVSLQIELKLNLGTLPEEINIISNHEKSTSWSTVSNASDSSK